MANTGFTVAGTEVSNPFVPKSYLIDRYPELAYAFKNAGLWGWGNNSFGQLGDNTNTPKSSPVQTVSGGTNWKQVSAGADGFTCCIKTDGTLWNWGYNAWGQLGNNNRSSQSSPVQTVAAGTNWKQVSCGRNFVAAIKTDGTLWMWGYNGEGQLGDNTIAAKSSPVQTVAGGTNWKQVSLGMHAAAIKTDGRLWVWGRNQSGELGTNTSSFTDKSSPVQTVAAGTNWKQVSAAPEITAAIKTDGTLWAWGRNDIGVLGDNTTVAKSSPVQTVAAGTNWKQVSVGNFSISAIKTDGTLWLWGYNAYGQLGTNDLTQYSSPVQTVAAGTNWKQVSIARSTSAIKTDGTLWVWGDNVNGQLGDNTIIKKSSPVQTIAGGTNWKQCSVGYKCQSVIRDDSADYGIGTL